MAEVVLKPSRPPRIEGGHPWIFRSEIEAIQGAFEPGDILPVRTARGRLLGHAYVNPRSVITGRMVSRGPRPVDRELWRERIAQAARLRETTFPGERSYRLLNAEADGIPGLIVDRMDSWLVVEVLTLGMERLRQEIGEMLLEVTGCRGAYERSEAPVRELEGLPARQGVLLGEEPPERIEVVEEDIVFRVDVRRGQKTGHYFDQRPNRLRIRAFAPGARVLDGFCHTGGFALHAARAGAREVLAIDSSEAALALARENAERNGLAGKIAFREGNVFDELRRLHRAGERFDLIILDPPAFAKNRAALEGAWRGYKEINLRALHLLVRGGILVTASCSQALGWPEFLQILYEAAADVGREVQILFRAGPGPDHPALLAAPETDYLKCVGLRCLT